MVTNRSFQLVLVHLGGHLVNAGLQQLFLLQCYRVWFGLALVFGPSECMYVQ